MRELIAVTLLTMAGTFSGCASDPPEPKAAATPPQEAVPPTRVELRVEAGSDINPDAGGRPSPLVVRIYQLKAAASFDQADFFELYQNEKNVLGADLIQKDEFVLRPGDTRGLAFEPKPETQTLAAFAAFRSLNAARWRASIPIVPHATNALHVRLSGTELALAAAPRTSESSGADKTR